MRTVYTQDDAPDLKRKGSPHRTRGLIYITPTNGADVEVEGADAIPGEIVAVASDGKAVWPVNELMLGTLQRAKRPPATKPDIKSKTSK